MSAFCRSAGTFCGPRMLLPKEPRMGSGCTSLVSFHRRSLGSSGAGATVAETGTTLRTLLGALTVAEAGRLLCLMAGAPHTECSPVKRAP